MIFTDFQDRIFLGNAVRNWEIAFFTALGVWLVLKLALTFATGRLRVIAARTTTRMDDLMVDLLERTKSYFLFAFAAYIGSRPLALEPNVELWISRALILVTVFQAAVWGNALIVFWLENYFRKRAETDSATATTIGLISTLTKAALYVTLLLVALNNFGVNISALVAGLGVGGIAVALAAQNILGDLFGSLTIVLDKPFVVGDFIQAGNDMGTVEHIGLKTTRVRSPTGEQLIFANKDLLESRLRNHKRMAERRVLARLGFAYETSPQQLERIPAMVRAAVEKHSDLRFDRCHFVQYGDSALLFEFVYWVKSPDFQLHMDRQQAVLLELGRQFASERIEFAFPTQTLHLKGLGAPPSVPGNA